MEHFACWINQNGLFDIVLYIYIKLLCYAMCGQAIFHFIVVCLDMASIYTVQMVHKWIRPFILTVTPFRTFGRAFTREQYGNLPLYTFKCACSYDAFATIRNSFSTLVICRRQIFGWKTIRAATFIVEHTSTK